LRAADGYADHAAPRGNVAKVLAILVEHLNTVGRWDVETAIGVEATAVATGALALRKTDSIEVCKFALVTELTIRAYVKNDESSGIWDLCWLPLSFGGRVLQNVLVLENIKADLLYLGLAYLLQHSIPQ
jgi:hypothetical protein